MLVCAHRGASMLRAAVEVVAEYVDSEAFGRAFVMLERAQDGQSQLLSVEGCPVLKHFLRCLLKSSVVEKPVRCPDEFSHANGVQLSVLRLEGA